MEATPKTDDTVEVSIVIPVYKSEHTLRELVARLNEVLTGIDCIYEIILVDDASPDAAWRVLTELRDRDERVKIIQHMRNFGQHHALLCGMAHSRGAVVVTMDDDLQNPPEEIPKLLHILESDPDIDVVLGSYHVKHHNLLRNLASKLLTRLTNQIFRRKSNLQLTSFRAIRRIVVDHLLADQRSFPRINPMILEITAKIRNEPVLHAPRKHSRSTYTIRRLVSDALTNILSNSSLPLQIVSCIGLFAALCSFALAGFFVVRYLTGGITVAGWTTVVVLILFTSGLILLSLGIVGEYLIRITKEIRKPARYSIRRKFL